MKRINLDFDDETEDMLNDAKRGIERAPTFSPPGPIPSPAQRQDEYHDFNQGPGSQPLQQPQPQIQSQYRAQQNQPEHPQQQQQQEEWGDDEGQDWGMDEGGVGDYRGGGLGVGIKVAGILLILLMIFIGYKSVTNISKKKGKDLENILRMNPTGGYYEGNNSSSPSNSTSIETEGVDVVDIANLETEIMRYERKLSLDGRPMLALESEVYGIYDIYIPHYKYTSLDNKGFLLVDAEVVNGKITFLYISDKQDNLNKLLDKNN